MVNACISMEGARLFPGDCGTHPPNAGQALAGAEAPTVSPSGQYIVVTGPNGTVAFARSTADQAPTMSDSVTEDVVAGCHQIQGAGGFFASVSPDGYTVAVPVYESRTASTGPGSCASTLPPAA
jgi:hypothetical protein